ncbi:MAG: hypothetical protein DRO04_02380, partial [Candidatus Iainarchaeum archaeon]
MNKRLAWTLVTTLIILTIGGLTIYLNPYSFEIRLQDGTVKAKYADGVLKVYSGRNLAYTSVPSVECYSDGSYKKVYKARGTKYSRLSYYKGNNSVYIKQIIFYSKGNLTRYFKITDYGIKEAYDWFPKDPNLKCRLRIKYGDLEKGKREVYLDSKRKILNFKANLDFNQVIDWKKELPKTSRVERFENGNLYILTKPFKGRFSYDPEVILDITALDKYPKYPLKQKVNLIDNGFKTRTLKIYSNEDFIDCVYIGGNKIKCEVKNETLLKEYLMYDYKKIYDEKGIPTTLTKFNNETNTTEQVYFKDELEFELPPPEHVEVGFGTIIINITDFYYGYGENISIDYDVELANTDYTLNTTGLVGWWRFTEDARDYSGQGNDGIVYGATHVHERFEFDGADDYIRVPFSQSLNITENITICAWFYHIEDGGTGVVFEKNSAGSVALHWEMWVQSNSLHGRFKNESGSFSSETETSGGVIEANKWYFGCLANNYNGTHSTETLWLNGQQIDSTIFEGKLYEDNYNFDIGNHFSATANFNGSIDEVFVYNRTLSASEIQEIYNKTLFKYRGEYEGSVLDFGSPVEGEYFKCTSESDSYSNVTCQIKPVRAVKPEEYPTDGLVSLWKLNPEHVPLTGDLANGLVSYWKFERNANDALGRNNGTLYGKPQVANGKVKYAYEFDGENDYIEIPNSQDLNLSGCNLTITAWIKLDDSQNYHGILSKTDKGWSEINPYHLVCSNSYGLDLRWVTEEDYKAEIYSTSIDVVDDSWHFIAAVREKNGNYCSAKLYVDGNEVSSICRMEYDSDWQT